MEGPLKNNYVEGQPSLNEWNENENEWLVNSISDNLTFSPENVENVSIRPWLCTSLFWVVVFSIIVILKH